MSTICGVLAAPPRWRLPDRAGPRPRTGATVPHLQHSDPSPTRIRHALAAWAFMALPGVWARRSRVSVASSQALWLDGSIPTNPDAVFMPPAGSREFAHLHADGSMHVCLPPAAEAEVLRSGWGEVHPLRAQGVPEVLAYAPRDEAELAVSQAILNAAYHHVRDV